METYTQANELNAVENALQREESIKEIFDAVDHEDKEEHEHDREADEESDYQCDEMIYN